MFAILPLFGLSTRKLMMCSRRFWYHHGMRCAGFLVLLALLVQAGCREQAMGVWGGKPTEYVTQILNQYRSRAKPPDEVFVLETRLPGGGPGDTIELAIRDGDGELRIFEEAGLTHRGDRFYRRAVSPIEVDLLRRFLDQNGIDQMQAVEFGGADGVEYQWTHLVHGFGRTVCVNNPEDGTTCDRLNGYMRAMADPRRMKVVYPNGLQPGLQLLFAQHERPIDRVWAKDSDIRVRMGGWHEDQGTWMRLTQGELSPCESPGAYGEKSFDSIPWYEYGVIGKWDHGPLPDRIRYGDVYVRGGEVMGQGAATWLCGSTTHPEMILDRPISDQLVTPSGKLVGTLDGRLVIFDLKKRTFIPISKQECSLNSYAYLYIPERRRVLVIHHDVDMEGLTGSQWRLLDPETGLSRACLLLSGRDDMHASKAVVPSSRRPGCYWVACSQNGQKDQPETSIMRLNSATMELEGWGRFTICGIAVATDGLWVDDSAGFAYCINDGHLFRIAIPAATYEPDPPDPHAVARPQPQDE
jgi:hypothetical protein